MSCVKSWIRSLVLNNNNNWLYLLGHEYIQYCKSFYKLKLKTVDSGSLKGANILDVKCRLYSRCAVKIRIGEVIILDQKFPKQAFFRLNGSSRS